MLIDCNLLVDTCPDSFLDLLSSSLNELTPQETSTEKSVPDDAFEWLSAALKAFFETMGHSLAFLVDSFDEPAPFFDRTLFNRLRALRDRYKYRLSFLFATRKPLEALIEKELLREFFDLFASNQIWLGPLEEEDAFWSLQRFCERHQCTFDRDVVENLLHLSGGHPGLLRSLASVQRNSSPQSCTEWLEYPAVERECTLLWEDLPSAFQHSLRFGSADSALETTELVRNGEIFSPVFAGFIENQREDELVLLPSTGEVMVSNQPLEEHLTAKEYALLAFLYARSETICSKDALIRAVWPEDAVFEKGVRDDNLAQIVRRIRIKIEPDSSTPRFLVTVPGRGYILHRKG